MLSLINTTAYYRHSVGLFSLLISRFVQFYSSALHSKVPGNFGKAYTSTVHKNNLAWSSRNRHPPSCWIRIQIRSFVVIGNPTIQEKAIWLPNNDCYMHIPFYVYSTKPKSNVQCLWPPGRILHALPQGAVKAPYSWTPAINALYHFIEWHTISESA